MSESSWPESWTWAADPVDGGPCVLVDVDGVIANGWHRQHFLQDGRKDWKNFFANAFGDTPIEGSRALVDQFAEAGQVVLLTARPNSLREVTLDWLGEHGYRWDLLVLRGPGDGRYSSPDFKQRCVADLRSYGFVPQLALDDDQRNVDMFRDEGIETLYIHSGYYEA